MKTVVINASPRRRWNTAQIMKEAAKGAESAGAEVEYVDLYKLDLHGCMSCLVCKKADKERCKCYWKDELSPLIERILDADTLLIGSPMCSANKHYSRLEVENTTFEQEFSEVDWNSVPQIDKDSSAILGNRKMGTLTDMVSQFNVMNEYTIINYNGSPVRVSPLGYDGLFIYRIYFK